MLKYRRLPRLRGCQKISSLGSMVRAFTLKMTRELGSNVRSYATEGPKEARRILLPLEPPSPPPFSRVHHFTEHFLT